MRRRLTYFLLLVLLLSSLWTAWQWLRPYDLKNTLALEVDTVSVRRDHNYAWVDIVVNPRSNKKITVPPLTRLKNFNGAEKIPAEVWLSSDGSRCEFRYWLEWSELENAWQLQIEDGILRIKEKGAIQLKSGQHRIYHQPNW